MGQYGIRIIIGILGIRSKEFQGSFKGVCVDIRLDLNIENIDLKS